MIQRKYRLHSDWQDERLDCGGNISVGNEQIHVGTWQADRPRSRLSDGIVMCLIALETVELFKISECWHWAPKNDIWALMSFLLFFSSFLHQFFSFFACSGMGVGLQKCAFLSHTILDVIPSVSSASWWFLCEWWLSASAVVSCIRIVFLCNRWLRWGSIMLILRTRIVWYWCYLPCSLYQTCLVRDTERVHPEYPAFSMSISSASPQWWSKWQLFTQWQPISSGKSWEWTSCMWHRAQHWWDLPWWRQ